MSEFTHSIKEYVAHRKERNLPACYGSVRNRILKNLIITGNGGKINPEQADSVYDDVDQTKSGNNGLKGIYGGW